MWKQKIQQITSLFLISSLLFSFTLQVPTELFFASRAYAAEKEFVNLVSVIVDEDSYDELRSKLVRYSRDIQGVLENTRVVIVPTPSDASVLDIASLNESLYYEGYKSLDEVDYESRLVGTVLVGKLPVPHVFDGGNSAKSILPYVDFENKSYIYNHESEKYERNLDADLELTPEIWHGVISPNTGDVSEDIQDLKDYFDKNHDFYIGDGVFDESLGVIDGKNTDALDSYEPHVFYYDQFRENTALQYQNYQGYELYRENIEDITYNRYSKDLAERVSDQILGNQNAEIIDLLADVDPDFDLSGVSLGPDVASSSDVLTRYITDNATKKFLEVFNGSTLGEMRQDVFNAGRYNTSGSEVNVDIPPFLISVLDEVSSEVIKNVNTSLETQITDLVANGLSREIAIPLVSSVNSNNTPTCSSRWRGFYYGQIANDITSAAQCSIYRGNTNGGTLVEANRGYNVTLSEADNALCQSEYSSGDDDAYNISRGYWGANTPLNLDLPETNVLSDIFITGNDLSGGIRPIYDISGAKEINDASKNPSPIDCFTDGVLLKTYQQDVDTTCNEQGCDQVCSGTLFQAPVLTYNAAGTWSCRTVNPQDNFTNFAASLASMTGGNSTVADGGTCVNSTLRLNGTAIRTQNQTCSGGGQDGCTCTAVARNLEYKSIPSYILHTSPTDEEFGTQVGSLFTPSLPIDTDRYIDFIGANGGSAPDYGYQRIDFPQLFRVSFPDASNINFASASVQVKEMLDNVSSQINSVISASDPSSLSGEELALYNELETGSFPSANVDLYTTMSNRATETFTQNGQSKEISYFDTLVFAVYWNSLDTPSAKYKFIFENYLSNEFEGNDYDFHLPKSKQFYETAYFAAPGDAQNMYVKLDPELKGIHPYADIISANIALGTTIVGANVGDETLGEGSFECAPPDGVNIFQWIPAVICWLQEMLPPTIKISQGACGEDLFSDEELEEIQACSIDENNNGITDCFEQKLIGGTLKLVSDAGRYYYFTTGVILSETITNEGDLAIFDSNSYVRHSLSRLVVPDDSETAFTDSNSRVIYDASIPSLSTPEALEEAEQYISFNNVELRNSRGTTKTYFYGKGQDANAYFTASLETRDSSGNIAIELQSEEIEVGIRGDRVYVGTYKVEDSANYSIGTDIIASQHANVCAVDGANTSLGEAVLQADTLSQAKEKLLLMIQNYSRAGNVLELNYPLSLEMKISGESVFLQEGIQENTLEDVYELLNISRSGRYEVHVRDAVGFHSYRVFDVLPESAQKIETVLGTNIVETGGNVSTHLISILDQFDNAASGEIYTVDIAIDGNGLEFSDNGEDEIRYQVIDGYKAFRVKSTGSEDINTLNIEVRNLSGDLIDSQSLEIRTIDTINLDVSLQGDTPKVGGGEYEYDIEFTDEGGNLLTDLSSRVYFKLHSLYGSSTTPYVDVIGGRATVKMLTSTLAAQDIEVEFQLEGGNDIYKESITILPDDPIKVDVRLSRDKIEASSEDSSILEAILKDRYNNDVFTDNTTDINLEIHSDTTDIITANITSNTVSSGKSQFILSGTDIPGLGYFKVSTFPDLAENSFDIIGQSPFSKADLNVPTMTTAGNELTQRGELFFSEYSEGQYISNFSTKARLLQSSAYRDLPLVIQEQVNNFWDTTNSFTVNGLGENAGNIETFFFWDQEDIRGNAYNGMYSVLLGAPYGDVTQEDYLAGALLFDRDNASLAVTSLVNNPYVHNDVLTFEENGFTEILSHGDITQDIELEADFTNEGILYLDIHNSALETYIGRAYYKFSEDNDIILDIAEGTGYSLESVGNDARVIAPSGKEVLEVKSEGRFTRKSSLYVEYNAEHNASGIKLNLMHGGDVIGTMLVEDDLDINITRDSSIFQNKLQILEDVVLLHITSNQYSSRAIQGLSGSSVSLHYHDPFSSPNVLDDFHNNDISGFESSLDESGIGWRDSNTMLLSFSAGESVGQASQRFQSFSLINLGDPVVSLKDIRETFRGSTTQKYFDSTIGNIIDDSEGLIGYQVFDYDNDNVKDILTIHRDGYVSLYEGEDISNDYVYQRDLVFAADGGGVHLVKTGDFTGDGYDDIFFVTQFGEAAIYNNHEKDFYRYDISSEITLSGAIIQAESFDMDSDGKHDIVTLDDAGQVHIFYGNGESESPSFEKKFIGDGYAIELSETATSQGGGVYFDGLIQLTDDRSTEILTNSASYLSELQAAIDAGNTETSPEFIDTNLVDSFLYISLPYVPAFFTDTRSQGEILTESLTSQIVGDDTASEATNESVTDFLSQYSEYVTYTGFGESEPVETYFIRSQYADTQGLEITKTFTDETPSYLQTGDTVYFDITIKNTSSTRKDNIAYVDKIPAYFQFASQNFTVLTQDNLEVQRKIGIDNYQILLDGFFLDPGEETTVRYELTTLPLSYGYMQVGLYEAGELGDDIYGDIILKDDEQNCGQTADIYRSTDVRSYQGGITTPSCEAADIEVGNTFPELQDSDNDGIPDYLQGLLDAQDGSTQADIELLQEYSEDILEELGVDSDNDGIPDSEDTMDSTDSGTDFMAAIGAINEAVDEISEDIDELIQGLSCGFGGGSCIATPLNWAPLAPGGDPTLFGRPIGNGLIVGEGNPVFSALTGRPVYTSSGCFEVPTVYPVSSDTFDGSCGGPAGAGGSQGINSPTNFVRMFATPTLTGGFGIAVCFGGSASVAGNGNPRGVHPVVPGGNCIVTAMPLMSCEGDEGDPGSLGYPYPGNGFGLIHANCDGTESNDLRTPLEIEGDFVLDYLDYLETGVEPAGMYDRYVDTFSQISENGASNYNLPTEPLINIGGGADTGMGGSVNLDANALGTGNFEDVIQIDNKRVAGFPGFIMDWVERQLDEVTSKLTNLPKIFVILPDFGGIFDFSFENFGEGISESFTNGKEDSDASRSSADADIAALRSQKSGLECSGADSVACRAIDLKIVSAQGQKYAGSGKETLSGIREVYEFMGNIPLLNVESEKIAVNVPWIEGIELDRFILDWNLTLEQWKGELESKSQSWTNGETCSGTAAEIERCQQENDVKNKAYLEADAFVASLEKNIQVLEEYKQFPDKLAKLINIKEVWLEQILCNVEAISKLMGEWINSNGERFKAWVELYVLIKAILKSWQLFIDVFADYEAECHECKNERQDLQDFTFQLISAVIPSAPIIQFPKWPDIILDLHNVRAGLTVYMPDFEINMRPIVLPTLPKLELPDVPSAGFTLPAIPTLPSFELPELPELPSLPTVELPDLPPPPKIPKLFGAVEGMLNIMKLVTKAMCFLKQSPFVPEWRAGDQIAFLTERNGYIPTDFIDVQPPSFSYSAVSAIKVTTYVNLEFEMEFLLEAVRAITAPIDDISNNIANMFDISLSDINLSEAIPSDINLELDTSGDINTETSFAPLDQNPESILTLVSIFSGQFVKLISYMSENSHKTMTNGEFMAYVGNGLASSSFTQDHRTEELRNLWTDVQNLTYVKEDEFIRELKSDSAKRFETFEDILREEIEYSQKQQEDLKNIDQPELYISVSSESTDRISDYNERLDPYNAASLEAAINLVSGQSQADREFESEIQRQGEELMQTVRGGLQTYQNGALLAAEGGYSADAGGACHSSGAYEFNYDGIYVLQDNKNYRLFDYTSGLKGDEEITLSDIDNDGDDDVLYLMGGKLYMKENRQQDGEKNYISLPPLIVQVSDNKFLNGDIYHEAINGFSEASVSDNAINIEFGKPTDTSINNFRIEYNTIIDRYMDDRDSYIPQDIATHIIDAQANINTDNILDQTSDYRISPHNASLVYAGGMNGVKLTNERLVNLRDDLESNTLVTLTSGTDIYANDTAFTLSYRVGKGDEQEVVVRRYETLSFDKPVEVTALRGDAFISLGIQEDIEDTDLISYIGMPILPGAKIEFTGNKDLLDESSHIDILYSDGSEIQLDMRDIASYVFYDLGNSQNDTYNIRLQVPNDFYYARIWALDGEITSTASKQILLSPQVYSDNLAPQIGLNQKIRIPVYQSQKIDLTPYIYEDGGLSGISDVWVDMFLNIDGDGDGDAKNDVSTQNIQITKNAAKIEIEFGPYDELVDKTIMIHIEDDNRNIGSREVGFEVYSPKPTIIGVEDTIITGVLDEDLLDEPVRLYRYRGGVIQKLESIDGEDVISTDDVGNYDFETSQRTQGLSLTYSGSEVASINEYTGRIDILNPLVQTRVLATNNPDNTSVYPEVRIERLGETIFKQFYKIPEGEVTEVSSFDTVEEEGIYVRLIDGEGYGSYKIPLGTNFNPGSVSLYSLNDSLKTAVMTVFADGRIQIDRDRFRLEYRYTGDRASLVLVDIGNTKDVAEIIYNTQASYILK